MRWGVLWGEFVGDGTDRWLDDVLGKDRHDFVKIPAGLQEESWHQRSSDRTRLSRWLRSGADQLDRADVDGVITLFPPLAVTTGLRKRLRRRRFKHVAWAFNLGHHPHGWKRWASSFALANVDRIVVHSAGEVEIVRNLFGLSEKQVQFVHLQGPDRPYLADEDRDHPFLVAIGSANRDYSTLIEALRMTGLPAKIVTSPRIATKLRPPANVEIISGITWEECLRLTQRARISVTPLADAGIAAGQVTIIDALTMGRPVIATRSIGTIDYIRDGSTGVLVEPNHIESMAEALGTLWHEEDTRRRIGEAGHAFAKTTLSDPIIAKRFGQVLDDVEQEG